MNFARYGLMRLIVIVGGIATDVALVADLRTTIPIVIAARKNSAR